LRFGSWSIRLSIVVAFLLATILPIFEWKMRAAPADWIGHDVDGLHYEVLLPEHYDHARSYPLILYLHQLDAGTYRDSLRRQVNRWFNATAFRSAHPCIVVVPMLDQKNDPRGADINFGGKTTGRYGQAQTIAALKQVMQQYHVDSDRVYVTGNSMGGMGTWDVLLHYNSLDGDRGRIFAAGMPLSGTHRTANLEQVAQTLRQVPIWAIHGAKDEEISPEWDRKFAQLLSGNPAFRYTEAPDLGHDVWDTFYARPDVWNWLFAQVAQHDRGPQPSASGPAPSPPRSPD